MRVMTSKSFRLLASLFAALALAFGGAGVASAASTSNSVSSNGCHNWDRDGFCVGGNFGRFDDRHRGFDDFRHFHDSQFLRVFIILR